MFGATDTLRDSPSHANVVFGLLQQMTQPQQMLMWVKHHQTLKKNMAQSSQVHKQPALAIACLDMQPSPILLHNTCTIVQQVKSFRFCKRYSKRSIALMHLQNPAQLQHFKKL